MSFWQKLFPYRSHLEDEVSHLRAKNRLLLDRVMLLATGAPLETPVIEPLTPEQKENVRRRVDEAAGSDIPFGGYPTFAQMLQGIEAKTFQENADDILGQEEIQPGAEVVNAVEASTEEDHKRALLARKRLQQQVASAVTEYKTNLRPVDTEVEN